MGMQCHDSYQLVCNWAMGFLVRPGRKGLGLGPTWPADPPPNWNVRINFISDTEVDPRWISIRPSICRNTLLPLHQKSPWLRSLPICHASNAYCLGFIPEARCYMIITIYAVGHWLKDWDLLIWLVCWTFSIQNRPTSMVWITFFVFLVKNCFVHLMMGNAYATSAGNGPEVSLLCLHSFTYLNSAQA